METIVCKQHRYTKAEIKTMFEYLAQRAINQEDGKLHNAALMLIQLFEDREKLQPKGERIMTNEIAGITLEISNGGTVTRKHYSRAEIIKTHDMIMRSNADPRVHNVAAMLMTLLEGRTALFNGLQMALDLIPPHKQSIVAKERELLEEMRPE